MVHYVAKPTSRLELRILAKRVRKQLGFLDKEKFPVAMLLEMILPIIDKKFDYEIIPYNEMPEGIEALTYPDEHRMEIREDVYENMIDGDPRARLTIMHEFGHYLLHEECNIKFARMLDDVKPPAYLDPEWQASAFAGEIMMPYELVKNMSGVYEVMEKCGVSKAAATYQLKKYKLL